MHNLVNEINSKRIFTFEEGFKEIENSVEKCNTIEKFSNNNTNHFQYIGIILAVIILSIILFIRIK